MAYYAVPGNIQAVAAFRDQVIRHWRRTLLRRSQKTRINWERMHRIATRWLPRARVMHPLPGDTLRRHAPKVGAQCGNPARWDLRGGPPVRAVPTATIHGQPEEPYWMGMLMTWVLAHPAGASR